MIFIYIGIGCVMIYSYLSTMHDVVGPLIRRRRWMRTHRGVNTQAGRKSGGKHRKES